MSQNETKPKLTDSQRRNLRRKMTKLAHLEAARAPSSSSSGKSGGSSSSEAKVATAVVPTDEVQPNSSTAVVSQNKNGEVAEDSRMELFIQRMMQAQSQDSDRKRDEDKKEADAREKRAIARDEAAARRTDELCARLDVLEKANSDYSENEEAVASQAAGLKTTRKVVKSAKPPAPDQGTSRAASRLTASAATENT